MFLGSSLCSPRKHSHTQAGGKGKENRGELEERLQDRTILNDYSSTEQSEVGSEDCLAGADAPEGS